jgi:hypothetical protein
MAAFSLTNVSIALDGTIVTGYCNQVDTQASVDMLDFTTFASGGWKTMRPGFASFTLGLQGFQDYATNALDQSFPLSSAGGTDTFTVAPTGGAAVADPAYFGQGLLNSYTPLTAAVGQPANFNFQWAGINQLVRGQMLHPSAARTATGNGTATTFTTPTATQALYAAFHVTSVTGTGTITFKVQTANSGAFTVPNDRITSNGFTATGAQFASLAGALAGETHIRAQWTITGFTSVTFQVAAGVL